MKSLATSDDTLSQDEECKLVEVVKDKLPKEDNPGSRVGKRLADMADEIDGIIALDSDKQLTTHTKSLEISLNNTSWIC